MEYPSLDTPRFTGTLRVFTAVFNTTSTDGGIDGELLEKKRKKRQQTLSSPSLTWRQLCDSLIEKCDRQKLQEVRLNYIVHVYNFV